MSGWAAATAATSVVHLRVAVVARSGPPGTRVAVATGRVPSRSAGRKDQTTRVAGSRARAGEALRQDDAVGGQPSPTGRTSVADGRRPGRPPRYASAMTELETRPRGGRHLGRGPCGRRGLGPNGVLATRGDPGGRLPLGVGDEARHRADRARRLRARPARPRRAGRPARGRPSGICSRTPRGSRSREPGRWPRPGRAGSTPTRVSTCSGALVAERTGRPFDAMHPAPRSSTRSGWPRPTLVERPSAGLHGPLADLVALRARVPPARRCVAPATFADRDDASRFPGSSGVVPGCRPIRPVRLGSRLRAPRRQGAALDGPRAHSPATFGHFGGAGTFLWVDPVARVATAVLTDREFGPWALAAWPVFSDGGAGRRAAVACSPST